MSLQARVVETFPTARIPSQSGGLPVEVSLIAQLGHGSGNHLYAAALSRQRAHNDYIDALDEPSAKLAGTHLEQGDPTSLYTFAVGAKGHPFHRHAGHRVFTAISGSGGAQLRFSSASPAQIARDPASFLHALRYVNIPPDCMFTVRFGGDTWHQFSPLAEHSAHPTFFALSCHTNELGGDLSDALRQQVMANEATIPALTELLPANVLALLETAEPRHIPTIELALDAAPDSWQSQLCGFARSSMGRLRGAWARWRRASGFLRESGGRHTVIQLAQPPEDALLRSQLNERFHHQDMFSLSLSEHRFTGASASKLLAALLDGFLQNPPAGVSRMMTLRNAVVRPLGLRTSSLGCPVSSLLSKQPQHLFAGRYPVLDQSIDNGDTHAQVILGADDKHLRFRSCIGVRIIDGQRVEFTLATRVQCKNLFGHIYMALIEHVHRRYVSPTMLRMAVEHAFD